MEAMLDASLGLERPAPLFQGGGVHHGCGREEAYSAINILGLAIGMAVAPSMPSGWDGRRVQLGTLRSVRHLEATKKRRSAEGEEERVLGGWSSAQQVGYLAKEHQARVRGG